METTTSTKSLNYSAKQTTISSNNKINSSIDTSNNQSLNTKNNTSVTTETLDLSSETEVKESKSILDSIGDGLQSAGATISNGFKSIGDWAIGGLKGIGANLKETAANVGDNVQSMINSLGEWLDGTPVATALGTAAVAVGSAVSGLVNLFEGLADGVYWGVGKLGRGVTWLIGEGAGLFSQEAKESIQQAGKDFDGMMKEVIEDDLSGSLHSWAFNTPLGSWLNKNSLIKYDSELAQKISGGAEVAAKFAAATAITVATGGLAAPASFAWVFGTGMLVGLGQNAEKVYNEKENADWKDELGILIRGAGEGLNWYAQGKLGQGFVRGITAVKSIGLGESLDLVKGAASNAWTTLKSQGLKTTLSNILTKENMLNAAHKAIFDSDNLRDSLAIAGDNLAAWVTGEEEFNLQSLSKAVGEVALVYGTSTLTDAFVGGTFGKRIEDLQRREAEIPDRIREFAGEYGDQSKIDSINGTFRYEDADTFRKSSKGRNWSGFNNGSQSVIKVDTETNDLIVQTMLHESMHQSSHAPGFYDGGRWIHNAGIQTIYWDPTTSTSSRLYMGLNESITEYFTQLVMGDTYKPGHCGYEPAVKRLKQMVELGILDLDTLKRAYFTNDSSAIISRFIHIFESKGLSGDPRDIFKAFDDAIGDGPTERARGLAELASWIKKMV